MLHEDGRRVRKRPMPERLAEAMRKDQQKQLEQMGSATTWGGGRDRPKPADVVHSFVLRTRARLADPPAATRNSGGGH